MRIVTFEFFIVKYRGLCNYAFLVFPLKKMIDESASFTIWVRYGVLDSDVKIDIKIR